jgi:hypothetical protein
MKKKRPSCDDYMRMPLSQEVIDHIRSCDKCRALYNALADEVDRHAYEFEHRN